MKWQSLNSERVLKDIIQKSLTKPQIIFKHSTTCPISAMAKNRLESSWDLEYDAHYLDLISYRSISNAIADQLSVKHESPQVIVIKNGEAIYNESHLDINIEDIKASLL